MFSLKDKKVLIIGGSYGMGLATAEAVLEAGLEIAAIVHVGRAFSISYSRGPVTNTRFADVEGWCAALAWPHDTG